MLTGMRQPRTLCMGISTEPEAQLEAVMHAK